MSEKAAGIPQAFILLAGCCLPILGAVLLAPVLPLMEQHFADDPHVSTLVPISLTIPALMIALFAPLSGTIADRFGRKRCLLICIGFYALCGILPLWLDSLGLIVLSRAGIGIAEAGIMTCCTALMGDYFHGRQRERIFALQMVATSLSAAIFIALGGVLAQHDWRVPFWVYSAGFIFLPLMAALLWDPAAQQTDSQPDIVTLAPMPWRPLLPLCLLSLFAGISLFIVPVQAGYLLNLLSVDDPAKIGMTMGANQLGVLVGAASFRLISHFRRSVVMMAAFALTATGSLLMASAAQHLLLTLAVTLSGIGMGIMLPSLITSIMALVNFDQRGRAAGMFNAMIFLGEFISPLLVLSITRGVTTVIPHALTIIAALQLLIAILVVIRVLPVRSPAVAFDS
ncbi:MFS transporter [Pokkaliibacter plantistimulans]|uniref:MFS transporter n=1 Tax=Proteobacteria bacterium 228 TaxID=2083153 RepID=A0A2S5KM76_9PROT|nr:MFS transporter [Pokkaliibacter plantistimulans]PPC75745.1 MFS transporter [Pokkaliibacter plantistimulans]